MTDDEFATHMDAYFRERQRGIAAAQNKSFNEHVDKIKPTDSKQRWQIAVEWLIGAYSSIHARLDTEVYGAQYIRQKVAERKADAAASESGEASEAKADTEEANLKAAG